MKTYKFKTKISGKGNIHVPNDSDLYDREVEVIIISEKNNQDLKMKASDFVSKWAGFLTESKTDQSKLDYLAEKYK
jgi:hypothetical protein